MFCIYSHLYAIKEGPGATGIKKPRGLQPDY